MTRAQEIAYARGPRHRRWPPRCEHPYSMDTNLWGRSVSCGALEDPWARAAGRRVHAHAPRSSMGPREPAYVELTFERGRAGRAQRRADAARRADRRRRHDCRRPRRRPGRHGREPAARHQVARGPRSAGRRRAARGAPRSAGVRDDARARSRLRVTSAPPTPTWCTTASGSRDARRGHRRVRRRRAAARDGRRSPEAVPRRLPGRRPPVAVRRVRSRPQHLRRRRPVRSLRRRGLHPDLGPPGRDIGPHGCARRPAGVNRAPSR